MFKSILLSSLVCATAVSAVSYDWTVSWVSRNPDGLQARPVIAINGQWPLPAITAAVGEEIVVKLTNNLGNETTGMHFHGLFQNGTTAMDGPTGLTQCAVPPGQTITQRFTVNQPGTYWYHSHNRGQYPDGFRGPLLIHDAESPHISTYDGELALTLSDWYHGQMPDLIPFYLSVTQNPDGGEPIPDSGLMNDAATTTFHVQAGQRYMVRIINMSNLAAWYLHFDGHPMTVVEVDGVYTKKQPTDLIYLSAGQRMSVLITAKPQNNKNFAFVGSMDPKMFDGGVPARLNPNATGYLVYDKSKPLPAQPVISSFATALDDITLAPQDGQALFAPVTRQIIYNIDFVTAFNQNRALVNGKTFVEQKVPTLYTVMSAGKQATNPIIYGENSIPSVINRHDVVEVVVNNHDTGGHPIHMHGHNFQVVERGAIGASDYSGKLTNPPAAPIRRDVAKVNAQSYLVYRFRADNPDKSPSFLCNAQQGVWAFHCHIDWHVEAGFFATIIESPLDVQSQKIPADHYKMCKVQGLPTEGNAAGNTKDFTDLTGANTAPPVQNHGALV